MAVRGLITEARMIDVLDSTRAVWAMAVGDNELR